MRHYFSSRQNVLPMLTRFAFHFPQIFYMRKSIYMALAKIWGMVSIGNILHIGEGAHLTLAELERHLIQLGYRKTETDFYRGCFRTTPHNIEIFLPQLGHSKGIRVEFYKQSVESIYSIDPLSGRFVARASDILLKSISFSLHIVGSEEETLQSVYKI